MQGVLHWLEQLPNVRGDALHKIPLLLEGLLQYCIGSLQVFARHPGHDIH